MGGVRRLLSVAVLPRWRRFPGSLAVANDSVHPFVCQMVLEEISSRPGCRQKQGREHAQVGGLACAVEFGIQCGTVTGAAAAGVTRRKKALGSSSDCGIFFASQNDNHLFSCG